MTNKPPPLEDVNTREYWLAAMRDPSAFGMTPQQAEAMSESLGLSDPVAWAELLKNPRELGLSAERANYLASHFLNGVRDSTDEFSVEWWDATVGANHWALLRNISPMIAAMLGCGLNPEKKSLLTAQGGSTDETVGQDFTRLHQRFVDLELSDGKPRSLRDWHQAAVEMQIKHHPWIGQYLAKTAAIIEPPANAHPDSVTVPVAPPIEWEAVVLPESYKPRTPFGTKIGRKEAQASIEMHWVVQAQARAWAIVKEQSERDLFPSQKNIAETIAKEFRLAAVYGVGDKPLSAGYIKRHALKGISSAAKKQLSTKTSQGK